MPRPFCALVQAPSAVAAWTARRLLSPEPLVGLVLVGLGLGLRVVAVCVPPERRTRETQSHRRGVRVAAAAWAAYGAADAAPHRCLEALAGLYVVAAADAALRLRMRRLAIAATRGKAA